jgi:nucleoside-diphosphate-sugar epimerase
MARVIVTGGSGKVGRACIEELLQHGYEVFNLDTTPPAKERARFTQVDLTDFGQTMDAMSGIDELYRTVDGVVHLAAIPRPSAHPNAMTFKTNTLSTYNVFESARKLGIKNLVWASSETLLGLPFDVPPPYIPLDEEYPARPETAYSLSKLLGEEMAKQFCRWDPELKIVALRLSNVMQPEVYAVSRLQCRLTFAQMEPVGLYRFQRWRPSDSQIVGNLAQRVSLVHHRKRRYRDDSIQRGTAR